MTVVFELMDLISIGGWVVAALGLLLALGNFKRSDEADNERATREIVEIGVKLSNVLQQLNEVRNDMSRYQMEQNDMNKRLVVVEQSTKSAHKRLDKIESGSSDREESL